MSQAIDFTVVVSFLKKSPLLEDMMPINIVFKRVETINYMLFLFVRFESMSMDIPNFYIMDLCFLELWDSRVI